MGELARRAGDLLRSALAERRPDATWHREYRVAGTPVDVAGVADDELVVVELEWRRADPADNAAKLFRHLSAGELGAVDRVVVCQCFSAYYDLASGGVSAKRKNAEFVGNVAAATIDRLRYRPVDLPVDPPKRGGDPPADLEGAIEDVAGTVVDAAR